MLVWRGLGILVFVIAFACSLVANVLSESVTGSKEYWETHAWPFGCAMMAAGAIVWCVAARVARRPARVLVDQSTGERLETQKSHDFFFIPMKYWAMILLAVGLTVIVTNFAPGPSRARAAEPAPTHERAASMEH